MCKPNRLPFAVLVVCLAACQKPLPPKPPLVETVAVLPFDNETNDLNAPDIMQHLVANALKNSPYRVSDVTEINDFLETKGIRDGGQLAIVDPVKLGKDLKVQALLFGYVESFNYVNVGYYVERKVTLSLKMVDAVTGQTLWENEGTGARRQFALKSEDAQKQFIGSIAEQTVEKALKTPLAEEARLATMQTLRTLPGYCFNGFATDAQSPTKFQQTGTNVLKGFIKK